MMMTQSSGGAVLPQNPTMPTCSMYLQTGDCNFGQSCRFHHPVQDSTRQATGSTGTGYSSMMSGGMQGQGMQRQVMQGYGAGTGQQSGISGYQKAMGSSAGMGGYSMNATSKTLGASASQAKKKCKMYEKTGKCPFGASCKFEHESEESVGSPTPGSSVYARRTAMVGTGGMMGASGSMSSMGTTGMSGMGTTGISGMGTTGISGMATTGMSGMGTAGMSGMGTTGMNGMGGTGMSGMGSTGVSGVGSSMMGGMNALQQQAQLNMASMQGNMMNPQVQAQMNMAALQQQQQQQQQQQIGFSGLGTIGEAGMMGGSNRTVSAGGGSSWLADGQQSGGMGGMSGMDQMMGQREQLLRGQGDMQGQMGTRAQLPQKDEVCVMWVQLAQCKYGDKCSFKHPPIDVANQKLYTYNSNPGKGICRYYERQGCCKFLERCNMDHPQPRRPICYAFMTMFSCPRGVKCKFRHLSADQAKEDLKQWEQERKRICAETLKKKDEPKKPAKAQPTLPKTRSAEAAGLKSGLSSTSEPAPKKVTTGSASKSAVSKETASTGRKVSVTGTGSKVSVSATSRPRICFAFKNSGFCQYEDTCRFKHLTKAQAEAQGL